MASAPQPFNPALLVVDLQEDFCPPNGALQVPSGRDIIPHVNKLLSFPFALKVATQDWHPRNHISFASYHTANNVDVTPFVSTITIKHPLPQLRDANAEFIPSYESQVWPDHCIQDTPGASFAEGLDRSQIQKVIKKGSHPQVEMYSAFTDPFHLPPFTHDSNSVCTSDLPELLHEKGITHVYVVGLAFDYCVKATAIDAVKFGYKTFVVREGVKAVSPGEGADKAEKEMTEAGVQIISQDGEELEWVKALRKQ
ncbi:NAD(+) salvage pathway protein [Rhizina undulata]